MVGPVPESVLSFKTKKSKICLLFKHCRDNAEHDKQIATISFFTGSTVGGARRYFRKDFFTTPEYYCLSISPKFDLPGICCKRWKINGGKLLTLASACGHRAGGKSFKMSVLNPPSPRAYRKRGFACRLLPQANGHARFVRVEMKIPVTPQ
jgi:hypothetical protein